jgi:hypothetical protein
LDGLREPFQDLLSAQRHGSGTLVAGEDVMRIVVRWTALWLSGGSLGVAAMLLLFQSQVAPDVYVASWLGHAAGLLFVAIVAGAIAVRPALGSTGRGMLFLMSGHVTAALGAQECLGSRVACANMTQAIGYWLPANTGPLWLFGPTFAALALGGALRAYSAGGGFAARAAR